MMIDARGMCDRKPFSESRVGSPEFHLAMLCDFASGVNQDSFVGSILSQRREGAKNRKVGNTRTRQRACARRFDAKASKSLRGPRARSARTGFSCIASKTFSET